MAGSNDGSLAETYSLIYAFLQTRSHPKAAEAIKKAAKDVVILKEGVSSVTGGDLLEIVKQWRAGNLAEPDKPVGYVPNIGTICLTHPTKDARSLPSSKKHDSSGSSSSSDDSSSDSSSSSSSSDSSSSSSDSSSSESSGDNSEQEVRLGLGMRKAAPAASVKQSTATPTNGTSTKPIKKKAAAPSTHSESSSDSESDAEKETKAKKTGKVAVKSKNGNKSSSDSSSSSSESSDSDSDSAPTVKGKAPLPPSASIKGKTGSSSSSSSSSPSSSSEDEASPPKSSIKNSKTAQKIEVVAVVDVKSIKKRRIAEDGTAIVTAVAKTEEEEPAPANTKTKTTNGKPPRKSNVPFQRIKAEQVSYLDERLKDNTFASKGGSSGDYGAKASADLIVTRGAGFRKEKNKKKRGSYRGGEITMASHSIKFT